MSFEIYLQRMKDGKLAPFARSHVDEIFGPRMAPHEPDARFVDLTYPDGPGGTLHVRPGSEISHITLSRPGAADVFEDLFALMKRVGAVLYWPGTAPSLVVVDEAVRADLPKDMMEALGPGILVRSGRDIIAAIKATP